MTKHLRALARGPEVDWARETHELFGEMLRAVAELQMLRIGEAAGVPFSDDDASDAAYAVIDALQVMNDFVERIDK